MNIQDLITGITASVLLVAMTVAFIIFLFKYGEEHSKLQNKKLKLEIKKLEKELNEND